MKIRNGFVSNSSSSSFVIPLNNGTFDCVADIALHMIPKRAVEDDDDVMYNIHRRLELGMESNHPISFNSYNFNTFIVKTDGGFFVSTCNNHDWEFEVGGMSYDDDQEHYILCEMPYCHKYYNATYDITGHPYGKLLSYGGYKEELCEKCRGELWVNDDKIPYCPNCGKVNEFKEWWKRHPISKTSLPQSIINGFKEVAKEAWDAARKN